jgi:hypothetical protein
VAIITSVNNIFESVSGVAGTQITKTNNGWGLSEDNAGIPKTTVEISEQDAWKIFTNTDREKKKYLTKISVNGDMEFGSRLIDFVAVLS